jgi:hypothetical protein
MKRSALILMLSLSVTAAFATHFTAPETLDCRETVLKLDLQLLTTHLVKYDLMHGLWTHVDEFGNHRTYQFNENDLAMIINEDASGYTFFQKAQWRVENFSGSPFLVLAGSDFSNEKLLRVELNCEGVILTDFVNNEVLKFAYKPMDKESRVNFVKANLFGDWTNITFGAENMAGTFQNIRFKADGTFNLIKMDGNAAQGTWEVSKDTRFLILFISQGQNNNASRTILSGIKNIDNHGLVLDQTVALGESNFELKTFTFIK